MANNYYEDYLADVMKLAKTMVIKSVTSPVATNKELMALGLEVNESDPRSWRYYMNIAGVYHYTNPRMTVKSIDTQEEIDFTSENLAIHRATAREYQYGTSYYRELVAQYPKNEILILGILNPVDIQTAIDAYDGEILWMDQSLIDSNEINLKELVQRRITAFVDRWHVEDYSHAEDLYDPARLSLLYANLAMFIITARLENCRTIHAHSFHIRQFLASNGNLDVYMDYMTKKQQLFFYRNLPYLHRNPGTQDTFGLLLNRVMIDRDLPMAQYTMAHNLAAMPEDLDPSVELVRKEMTPDYAGIPATTHSVYEVLSKEVPLARSNNLYVGDYEGITTTKMRYAKNSLVRTKVLESKVVDRSDSQVYSLADHLLNHWLYLAAKDRYRAVVTVNNPRTGEGIKLTVQDAFTLYLYAYNRSVGFDLPTVPAIVASRVRRIPKPSVADIYSVAASDLVEIELAQRLYAEAPPVSQYISTEAFYNAVEEVYEADIAAWKLAAHQQHYLKRGMVEAMADRLFCDVDIDLEGGKAYPDWLHERGLLFEDFGELEFEDLAAGLWSTATGSDLNTSISLTDVHRAMLGIMTRLSSYSVHFVRDINAEPIRAIPFKYLRFGDVTSSEESISARHLYRMEVLRRFGSDSGKRRVEDFNRLNITGHQSETYAKRRVNMGWKVVSRGLTEVERQVPMPRMRLRVLDNGPFDLGNGKVVSDRVVLPVGETEQDIPLATIVTQTILDGLKAPLIVYPELEDVLTVLGLDGFDDNDAVSNPTPSLVSKLTQPNLEGFDNNDGSF